MKLTYFTEQTLAKGSWGEKSQTPTIGFSKAGVIAFNKKAIDLLELQPGDKIALCQDEDVPENWYVFKEPNYGYLLRNTEFKKNGTMAFNHNVLRKTFLQSFGLDLETTYSFALEEEGMRVNLSKTFYHRIIVELEEEAKA